MDNVVQANIQAALTQNSLTYGEIFNIAFGKRTNLLDLYILLKKYLEIDEKVLPIHREERPGDVKHSLASIDKARKFLGYTPLYSLEEGLKITTKLAVHQ